MRVCNARYVSALVMAITACSAKVCSNSIWLSENSARRRPGDPDSADRRAVAHQRHRSIRPHRVDRGNAFMPVSGIGSKVRMWTSARVQDRPAQRGRVARTGHREVSLRMPPSCGRVAPICGAQMQHAVIQQCHHSRMPLRRIRVPARRSDRTPAVDRRARPTSPSARRWSRPAARSARRIRCCAG